MKGSQAAATEAKDGLLSEFRPDTHVSRSMADYSLEFRTLVPRVGGARNLTIFHQGLLEAQKGELGSRDLLTSLDQLIDLTILIEGHLCE
ncbi:hypothetical protein SKAU_G00414310 [Synaphobranchus kaupii]|uniref:Uncharacterized protein n=1 Tax=Synaphobranchus kaupii TaxID=118154 RepID=A0A9Q1E704_SYNKA|nr:hypothetical protein SKAU_G00414310 [Synaphobranchus kaupii]